MRSPRLLRRVAWLCVAIAGLCASSEVHARQAPPVLPELRDATQRRPLIFVPGIGGTKLREPDGGRILWGNARSLFVPRDGGYRMALPLDGREESPLVPFEPVLEIRLLGILKKDAYGPIVRLFERNGYRRGDLADPRPDDSFFFLDYDWRRSVVDGSRELARRLESLRDARGGGELEVDLICQSTAGLLCRWFARYGAATLAEAETGAARPVAGVGVSRLILLGTASGGSVDVLKELTRGRRYLYGIGRRWRQETLFTFPSLFESLPDDGAVFLDAHGRPLEVDLYDPEAWLRRGWSVFQPRVQRRLRARRHVERFGDDAAREGHLREMLGQARRLRDLLEIDREGYAPPRLYSVQGTYVPTPARLVLEDRPGGGVPRTVHPGEGISRRDPWLKALVFEPGDGHATHASQERLSPAETRALAHPTARVRGTHFEFILDPATWRLLLGYLIE